MARISPSEAGRRGGLIGGRSRSAAKLAAARRNGFQPQKPPQEAAALSEVEKLQPQPITERTVQPALFIRTGQAKKAE